MAFACHHICIHLLYYRQYCCVITSMFCAIPTVASLCSSTEFECHSGEKCIASRRQCDGIFDCFDFSDEDNCSTGT